MQHFLDFLNQCRWHKDAYASRSVASGRIHLGFLGKESSSDQYFHTRQVHGIAVKEAGGQESLIQQNPELLPVGDGLYSSTPHQTLAIKTADCLPILLYHTEKPFVMGLHCGWRSLTEGILAEAKKLMESRSLEWSGLRAVLGPCIQPPRFEVGSEVARRVFREGPAAGNGRLGCELASGQGALAIFKGQKADKWHFDLQTAACLALGSYGMLPESIEVIRVCTFDDARFHSYRRDAQDVGRNISWIRLESD